MSRRENNLKRMKETRKRSRMLRERTTGVDAGKPEGIWEQRDQMPEGEMESICNSNNDKILVESNYWDTVMARKGLFHISINAGAFRLLIPDSQLPCLADIRTGRLAVMTFGFHAVGGRPMCEIMFEDDSDNPFALWLSPGQFERAFSVADAGAGDRTLIVYTRGCVEAIKMPVFFREARTLPCLKAWMKCKIQEDPTMEDKTKMNPFTHITLNNGHSYLVPVSKVAPTTIKALWNLVKAGGGPIPASKGLSFCLTSDNGDCCAFSIYKNSVPVLMCVYHEGSQKAERVWNDLLSDNTWYGIERKMRMPSGSWLSVVLLPTAFLAGGDLAMLADFEQCVAETWRRLPVSERSPISSPALEHIVKNLKNETLFGRGT